MHFSKIYWIYWIQINTILPALTRLISSGIHYTVLFQLQELLEQATAAPSASPSLREIRSARIYARWDSEWLVRLGWRWLTPPKWVIADADRAGFGSHGVVVKHERAKISTVDINTQEHQHDGTRLRPRILDLLRVHKCCGLSDRQIRSKILQVPEYQHQLRHIWHLRSIHNLKDWRNLDGAAQEFRNLLWRICHSESIAYELIYSGHRGEGVYNFDFMITIEVCGSVARCPRISCLMFSNA